MEKTKLSQQLLYWLGSFSVAGIVLFFYFKVPLLPILLAGFLVLGITLLRYYFSKK